MLEYIHLEARSTHLSAALNNSLVFKRKFELPLITLLLASTRIYLVLRGQSSSALSSFFLVARSSLCWKMDVGMV